MCAIKKMLKAALIDGHQLWNSTHKQNTLSFVHAEWDKHHKFMYNYFIFF